MGQTPVRRVLKGRRRQPQLLHFQSCTDASSLPDLVAVDATTAPNVTTSQERTVEHVAVAAGTPQHHAAKYHQPTQLEVSRRSVVRNTCRPGMTKRSTCRPGMTLHLHRSCVQDEAAPPPTFDFQHCSIQTMLPRETRHRSAAIVRSGKADPRVSPEQHEWVDNSYTTMPSPM